MQIKYNVSGKQRKELVSAISELTGHASKYLGAPGFIYSVGPFTIHPDGMVNIPNTLGEETANSLVASLAEKGFAGENDMSIEVAAVSSTIEARERITPIRPMDGLTATAIENLKRLIASKDTLLRKSLGADELTIQLEPTAQRILFPNWLPLTEDFDELAAYNGLIDAMLDMAKTQKRVTAVERDADNEKYAFRCFLLRLGFIGSEYKAARKILLRNLTGNGAFKAPHEVEAAE